MQHNLQTAELKIKGKLRSDMTESVVSQGLQEEKPLVIV